MYGPIALARSPIVVLVAVVALIGTARAAEGHATGPAFVPVVERITPTVAGLEVSAEPSSGSPRMTLRARGPSRVEIPGVHGEPFLRVGPDGAWLNDRSASAPLLQGPLVTPRSQAPAAAPTWRKLGDRPEVSWFDPRAEFDGEQAPAEVVERGERATLATWTIPLTVDGAAVSVEGRVDWVPTPVDAQNVLLLVAVGGAVLWWLSGDTRLLSRVVAATALIGVASEAIRVAAELRDTPAPLALVPGLVLVAVSLPLVWRRDRYGVAAALAFGGYLLAVAVVRVRASGGLLTSGAGWLTTALGLLLVVGAAILLLGRERARTRASQTPAS